MTIVTRALSGMALLAAAGLFAATPAAAQSYPRTTGSGENVQIDYGPMGQATLVGGGRVMMGAVGGMNVDIVHLDSIFVQQPRQGFVPLTVGTGETQETVWVPAAMVDMFRRARTAPR